MLKLLPDRGQQRQRYLFVTQSICLLDCCCTAVVAAATRVIVTNSTYRSFVHRNSSSDFRHSVKMGRNGFFGGMAGIDAFGKVRAGSQTEIRKSC